jgi:transcriptional regulator with XRE-family HTH domain
MAKHASLLREIRTRLGFSQAECATALGVALETLRTWDAGRRPAPDAIVTQTRTLQAKRPRQDRVFLQVLANELHVRTLRAAAHDGRLAVTFSPRSYYGKVTATATRDAGARFMATWYRRTYGRGRGRLVPVCRLVVPANFADTLVGLRRRLGLSQPPHLGQLTGCSRAAGAKFSSTVCLSITR